MMKSWGKWNVTNIVYTLDKAKDNVPPKVTEHSGNVFTIINPKKLFEQWCDLNLSVKQYTIVKKFIWFDLHELIPHRIMASPNTHFVGCTYHPKV